MAKRSRRRKANVVDPERVLRGAIELDVRGLLDLIHDINPTERGLPRAEEERRYVLKSRLQSKLIRDFDAELEVESDDTQRVVAIRHRYGGGDGCHAILDELDDDVRAALRRRFDEHAAPSAAEPSPTREAPAAPPEPSSPPRDAASLDALLHAAEAHLEAYAYDEAREALEAAFDVSRGATAAAIPLLELLVELLGVDADVVALEPRLSRDAAKSPEVGGLMALATARAGDAAEAERWLRGVDDDIRRVEVHAALADRALTKGDLAAATTALNVVRALDPASPHVLRIERAIAEREQRERAPLEAQLAELDHDPDQARRLAEQIVARWPDSGVARRTLRRLDDQARADRLAALLQSADDAERDGALDRALEQLCAARSLCKDPTDRDALDRRVDALRARLDEEADTAAVNAATAA
ncbi:MAG TPA: hypothetical protein ENK57_03405, partial [Polyangiaceae bacterium]|nr:hypothetical protein [Polyangiaceae bacterium]